MGRNKYIRHVSNEVEDNSYHPGCMWGFIHALDYHHWHYNVKKMLHHKKYEGRRHEKGKENPQTSLILHDSDELQQFLDNSENRLLKTKNRMYRVNQSTKTSRVAKKRSLKTRIKALISKEVSEQGNGKKQKSGSSPRLLLRTQSIHHLEPSDHGLSEACKNKKPAIIFLPSSLDNSNRSLKVPNKPDQSNTCSMNNVSEHQFKKNGDILEIFKVNKDLFLKVVANADNGTGKFFNTLPYFSTKAMLTKSGSFPTADLSRRRNFKPSKLEHKKNEICFSPAEERFLDCTQVPELAVLKYKKHFRAKSWSLSYDYDCSMIDQKSSPVSQKSKRELKKEGHCEMVIPVKESKQTVEHEAKQDKSKGSIGASPLDGFSSGHVPSASEKDTAGRSGECANRDDETESSKRHELDGYFLSKLAVTHRRSSSLTESLDRYARLYEYSSRQEVKLHPSKSLKLRNEYDLLSGGQISFRRIRSLSHLDFFYPIQNEGPHDAHSEGWPLETVLENSSVVEENAQEEEIRAAVPVIADEKETFHASKHTENEIVERIDTVPKMGNVASLGVNLTNESSASMNDLKEKVDDSTIDKSTTYREEHIDYLGISAEMLSQSFLDSNSGACFLAETRPSYSSEGSEDICNHVDENDSPINSEQRVTADSISSSITNLENFEDTNKDSRNFGYSVLHKIDNADLYYVKEILERSGIRRDAFSATWHSLNQPVNPSVFEEMEVYWHKEFECSEEDMYGCSHHQLLFDLMNEELVQMYDRSLTYYPKALSSSCRVRPLPEGNPILDEVSASISTLLNRKPDRYQTLDNIVSQDLAKDDGWMNLHLETECVALELDDMIFDELLEEILSS